MTEVLVVQTRHGDEKLVAEIAVVGHGGSIGVVRNTDKAAAA